MPHHAAGRRIEPPVSSPSDVAQRKAEVADPGAAAGAASEAVEVPRVAVVPVALGRAEGELGQVGLAQQDGARFLQFRNGRGVLVGEEVGHQPRADGGADAPRPDLVLDRHRDAVHRAEVVPGGDGPLRFLSGGHGLAAADGQVGVELEVQAVDAVKVGGCSLHGRHFPLPNQLAQFRRGEEGNILLVHHSLLWRLFRQVARSLLPVAPFRFMSPHSSIGKFSLCPLLRGGHPRRR